MKFAASIRSSLSSIKNLAVVIILVALPSVPATAAITNAILFVTQVPLPTEVTSQEVTSSVCNVTSPFSNHLGDPAAAGRGGALWIRYADGSLTNLTWLAGYGTTNGLQGATSIAVREPSVEWSGTKALFSMVVGAPTAAGDTNRYVWQIYELSNFASKGQVPVIVPIPNQPTNYNNVSPTYGTDGRIIFASDRPRDGSAYLYPQREENLQLPTVTGLWSLDPSTGNLFLMEHSPSGSFKPFVDSFGRVLFTRWDHLSRDVRQLTDKNGQSTNNVFNWSSELPGSVMTTNTLEVFPEPQPSDTNALAGANMRGNAFNLFLPWQVNEDGTAQEIVNHMGRHELLAQVDSSTFTNNPDIVTLSAAQRFNTNYVANFFLSSEDPTTPGLLYAVDSPDIGTHTAGQIVTLTAATNVNADTMVINYITPKSTAIPNPFGVYRNPRMLSSGVLIASFTAAPTVDSNIGTALSPQPLYKFRLMTIAGGTTNGYLTTGFTNSVTYWVGSNQIFYAGPLWELDPVEVTPRPLPVAQKSAIDPIEASVFTEEGVDIPTFKSWLITNEYALVIGRNVTMRDHADRQQPYNLKVAWSGTQSIATTGTVYNLGYLQMFQADQLRSVKPDGTNSLPGRRVLAEPWHDSLEDNPPPLGKIPGSAQLGADGSFAVALPTRRAMSWQTVDTNGTPIVRERYWVSFQPGEIRTCVNCHGVNTANQLNQPMPTNKPEALRTFLRWWKVVNLPVTTGRIVFATGRDGNYEIYSMNPDGSAALNLTRTNSTDVIPRVSYDGRKIVFMSDRGQPGYQNVWSMNSDGTGLLNLTKTNLYGSSLWAAAPNFDGSKVIYMGPRTNAGGGYNLYVINGDGTGRTNLTANSGDGNFPYWSYDGSKIVFDSFRDTTTNNSGEEVYIMNANGSGQTRLTFSPGRDFYPVISPDGTKIAFNSERDGHRQIYMMNIDGSNQTNISNTATNVTDNTAYFSPDGKRLSFTSSRDGVGDEVYVMNIDGSGQTRITFNNALDVYPAWGNTASLPSPAVQLQFSAATYSTPVSSNAVTVTVTRAASSTGIVAVAYSTADGIAHAGTDYTSTNGLFTWIDGDMTARTFTVVPAADDHLAGPNKTFTVILSNVVNAAIGANSNATVTLLEAPYDAWKFINFGANANNATIAGDTANPDADGLVNLFEYALGGDPNLATRGLVPHSAGINFTRNFNASDITLKVEANSNLVTGNWNVIASHSGNSVWVTSPGVTVVDLGFGTVSLTETTNFSSRYYRLQISHP